MRYSQIVPVIFGCGTVKETGAHAKELGCSKVLLMSDAVTIGLAGYAACKESLDEAGISVVEYAKCLPDPPIELCEEAGVLAVAEQVDGIVAVGGGSVLDAAKAVSVLTKNSPPLAQYLDKPCLPGVPAILIPTTSGTGSEVTAFSVVTDTCSRAKVVLLSWGALGIVDPELTVSVPPAVTASTGMDVFAHSAEAIISSMRNPKSEVLAVEAIRRVMQYLPVAIRCGQNMEAREQLSIASNFAGIAFNDALTNLGHAIAHKIGAVKHVPHGIACALVLPEVLAWASRYVPEKVRVIGSAMGLSLDGAQGEDIGRHVAAAIRSFMKEIGIPSCAELGVTREDLLSFADGLLEDGVNHPANAIPHPIERGELDALLVAIAENG